MQIELDKCLEMFHCYARVEPTESIQKACFSTFRLVLKEGPTDGRMDGRTKPRIDLRFRILGS